MTVGRLNIAVFVVIVCLSFYVGESMGTVYTSMLEQAEYSEETREFHIVLTCKDSSRTGAYTTKWTWMEGSTRTNVMEDGGVSKMLVPNPVYTGMYKCEVCRTDNNCNSKTIDVRTKDVRMAMLEGKVDALINQKLESNEGTTYVHWGSSSCTAASAQLVYSGAMAGGGYIGTGSAANRLCLSMTPHLVESASNQRASISGDVYQTGDEDDENPVCAVCRVAAYDSSIMIPGTNVCPTGWTQQYWGYLLAGIYSYSTASEFICVDNKLESANNSAPMAAPKGSRLHFTEIECNNVLCPPYEKDKVVTCVVCAK